LLGNTSGLIIQGINFIFDQQISLFMKRYFHIAATCLSLGLLVFAGCAKAEKEPEDPTPTTTGTTLHPDFRWTPGSGPAVIASDAYFIPAYNNIVALKNTTSASVDITLDNLNEGGHSISSSSGITLEYNDGTNTYTGKSGSVNITDNDGTSISGSFNCVLNGGPGSINGQFTDIPHK
jgi:hypothetical protein